MIIESFNVRYAPGKKRWYMPLKLNSGSLRRTDFFHNDDVPTVHAKNLNGQLGRCQEKMQDDTTTSIEGNISIIYY